MSVIRATTQLLKQQERLKDQISAFEQKTAALQAQYDLIETALAAIKVAA